MITPGTYSCICLSSLRVCVTWFPLPLGGDHSRVSAVSSKPSMLAMQCLCSCCFHFLEFSLPESCISGPLSLYVYSNVTSCEVFLNHPRNTPYSQHFPSPFIYFIFHSIYWHIIFYNYLAFYVVFCTSRPLQLELRRICSFVLLYLLCLYVFIE